MTGEELSLPKQIWKRRLLTPMHTYQLQESRIMENQVNMTPPKETKQALITDLKEMDIYKVFHTKNSE